MMFGKLKNKFQAARVFEIPFEFEAGLDLNGKHHVKSYMCVGGERILINDAMELCKYGTIIEHNGIKYIPDLNSFEVLLSLYSRKPELSEDGGLAFSLAPQILDFIRERTRLKETTVSETVIISKNPVSPAVRLDYDPGGDLSIERGISHPGATDFINNEELCLSTDGNYIGFNGVFAPFSSEIFPAIEKLGESYKERIPHDSIPQFIGNYLPVLRNDFKVYMSETAGKISVQDAAVVPNIKVNSIDSGWLDFSMEYSVGGKNIGNDDITDGIGSYIEHDNFSWSQYNPKDIEAINNHLQDLSPIKTSTGYRVPITKFATFDDFIKKVGGTKETTDCYREFINEITDFKTDDSFYLPLDIEAHLLETGINLRPYQRVGIHWMNWMRKYYLNGVLADDMGLGKTIQACAVMGIGYRETNVKNLSLIICPKSVVRFWAREVKRCFPDIDTYEYVGTDRRRKIWRRKEPLIIVSTYATIARDAYFIKKVLLYFIILDEATKIKNPNTIRSRGIKSLQSMHRIALTGTPIENRPSELWSIFDFLMSGYLGKYGRFRNRFDDPIILGDDGRAKELSNRIRPFMMRRLKENVAKDIPEKIDISEWCDLTNEQRQIYLEIQEQRIVPVRNALARGEYVSYATNILPILTKLKQLCDHPSLITGVTDPVLGRSEKVDLIHEKIVEIRKKGESLVLFSHFLGALDIFERLSIDQGIDYIRIDGSTRNRQSLIDRFNAGGVPIAICSLMAGGHGITLTSANHVIHIDRWWNPAIEDQATDRVHRIGQDKIVYVYRIITKGTIEERIAELLERKRGISDMVIGHAARQKMQWTREELLELLKPLE